MSTGQSPLQIAKYPKMVTFSQEIHSDISNNWNYKHAQAIVQHSTRSLQQNMSVIASILRHHSLQSSPGLPPVLARVINWNKENIHSKLTVPCWRQHTVSVLRFSTTNKPSLCTLHPNKSATLLWYNVFYQYQYIVFYKVLNTSITSWRWPSTKKIWNMWEKVQYNYIYFKSANILPL